VDSTFIFCDLDDFNTRAIYIYIYICVWGGVFRIRSAELLGCYYTSHFEQTPFYQPMSHYRSLLSYEHLNLLEPSTYFMYHLLWHSEILRSAQNAFVFCLDLISAIISLYTINVSVFITEADSVYCAVRTAPLNQTATISFLKG
jgi:hypothetical protein